MLTGTDMAGFVLSGLRTDSFVPGRAVLAAVFAEGGKRSFVYRADRFAGFAKAGIQVL